MKKLLFLVVILLMSIFTSCEKEIENDQIIVDEIETKDAPLADELRTSEYWAQFYNAETNEYEYDIYYFKGNKKFVVGKLYVGYTDENSVVNFVLRYVITDKKLSIIDVGAGRFTNSWNVTGPSSDPESYIYYNPIASEDLLINNPVTVSVQGLEPGTKETTLLFPIKYYGEPNVTNVIRHWQNYLHLGVYNNKGKLTKEVDA